MADSATTALPLLELRRDKAQPAAPPPPPPPPPPPLPPLPPPLPLLPGAHSEGSVFHVDDEPGGVDASAAEYLEGDGIFLGPRPAAAAASSRWSMEVAGAPPLPVYSCTLICVLAER